jgi:hypothetical protein
MHGATITKKKDLVLFERFSFLARVFVRVHLFWNEIKSLSVSRSQLFKQLYFHYFCEVEKVKKSYIQENLRPVLRLFCKYESL